MFDERKVTNDQQVHFRHVIEAYCGEWGPESVIITVPLSYKSFMPPNLKVKLEYQNKFAVRVEFKGKIMVQHVMA